MLKQGVKLAGIGFLCGIAASTLISLLICTLSGAPLRFYPPELASKLGSTAAAATVQYLVSGLYGSTCMGTTLFYDVEALPLTLASALHCFVIVALFWPLALTMGWFANPWRILLVSTIQVAVYFLIWLGLWLWYKKQVDELNELNRAMQRREKLWDD